MHHERLSRLRRVALAHIETLPPGDATGARSDFIDGRAASDTVSEWSGYR